MSSVVSIKNKKKKLQIKLLILAAVLMIAHGGFAFLQEKKIIDQKLTEQFTFYVFKEQAYKLFSLGANDVASRINILYALYTPVNTNIPSINFKRLTASLNGTVALDPLNISPYLHITYYWSWAKREESRLEMAHFMKQGVDRFPQNWDIPYSLYMLLKDIDNETSMSYLKTAAERAALYDGPEWMVNLSSILMARGGEQMEAFLWLLENFKATDSIKQKKSILTQMERIENEFAEDKNMKEYMTEVINQIRSVFNEQ